MKKNLLKFVSILSFLALFPIIASATTTTGTCDSITGILKIICQIKEILNAIVPVLIVLGMIYFIWGVIQYVIAGGEEAKKKGKDVIIYGLIGLTVIIGMWGLVNIVVTDLGGAGTVPTLTPLTGPASTCTSITSTSKFQDVLCYITGIINNSIIPLIFAGAAVMFIWGVVNFFILNADEEAKRAQGKQFMLWGIIALAVMLSVWGLVGILRVTLGIDVGVAPSYLPQVTPPP